MADTVVQQVITYGLSGGGVFAAIGLALRTAYHRGQTEQTMKQMRGSLDAAHNKLRTHEATLNEGQVMFGKINTNLENMSKGIDEIKAAMIRHEEKE